MSLRDNSSSANRSSTTDTRGNGTGGAGTAGNGGNGGSNYTFRNYQSNPNIQGNWNTGGDITGTGSMSRGVNPVQQFSPLRPNPVASPPMRPMMPPPQIPPVIPPSTFPVPYEPVDVWGPSYRTDPGIIAQMLGGLSLSKPSTFPARPGATTRVGAPRDTNGTGNVGGGFGGGGGGGF